MNFSFDLNEFFSEKMIQSSITSPLWGETLSNQLDAPLLTEGFPAVSKSMAKSTLVWEISM